MTLVERLGEAGLFVDEAEELLDEVLWRAEMGDDLVVVAWHEANRWFAAGDERMGSAWLAVLEAVQKGRERAADGP